MDNSNLLSLVESLLKDIEFCFNDNDRHTELIYKKKSKKHLTLFEWLETYDDDMGLGFYDFYDHYKKIKAHLELIKQIDSIEIIRAKVINRIDRLPTKSFIKKSCESFTITENTVIFVMPTKFLVDVGDRQKPIIEKAFSEVLEKPMIVKFVLNKPEIKIVNRPKLPDIDIDDDLPF